MKIKGTRIVSFVLCIWMILEMLIQTGILSVAAQTYDQIYLVALIGADGTEIGRINTDSGPLTDGKVIFTLDETYEFDDSNFKDVADSVADELKDYSLKITSHYNNSTGSTGPFDIDITGADYELVTVSGTNWGVLFKLKYNDTITLNGGKPDNNIYVLIVGNEKPFDPDEAHTYNGVHAWRLRAKNGGNVVDTKYNGETPILLPEMVSKTACETYGDIIKEMYDFQIDYQNDQGNFSTYYVEEIEFEELKGDIATYRIRTRDTFYWNWGSLVECYVTVEIVKDATRLVYSDKDKDDADNMDVGVIEDTVTGVRRTLVMWPEEVDPDEFDTASQKAFAARFGEYKEFDRIARSKDGEWTEYFIDSITLDEELSKALSPGLRQCWAYLVTFVNDEGPVDDENNTLTFYIVVYGAFDESPFIVTDRVTDPENAFVNFFDYWLIDQFYNDYRYFGDGDEWSLPGLGINKDHLFIFAGGQAFGSQIPGSFVNRYGRWNVWTGNSEWGPKQNDGDDRGAAAGFNGSSLDGTYKPFRNIVNRILGSDGFPVLSILQSWINEIGNQYRGWFGTGTLAKTNESLAYLFDTKKTHEGKETFSDVKGLFRMDNQGYYYFDSNETFAELNVEDGNDKTNQKENRVTLYTKPWYLRNASGIPGGQFFPFNNWTNLFRDDGKDVYQINQDPENGERTALREQAGTLDPINHYFGMTLEVSFQQPVNGKLNRGAGEALPMTFEFSGDDDVWIFIDDVLVGDVGGIHDAVRITIDFSTGEIHYYALGVSGNTTTGSEFTDGGNKITLRSMFRDAGRENSVSWNGETFANGSIHDLKFFYLERGNDVSNCAIKFNLIPIFADRIRKVDENGEPLGNVTFNIYAAEEDENNYKSENAWHTIDEFKKVGYQLRENKFIEAGKPIATTTTNASTGYAELIDELRNPLDLTRARYFIIEEVSTPAGYRTNPDIIVKYDQKTDTFTVVNKYETGAYASFMTEWLQVDKDDKDENPATVPATYANYNPSTGRFGDSGTEVNQDNPDALEEGLSLVIPVIKLLDAYGNFRRWLPMYGSNTKGWFTISESFQDDNINTNNEAQFMLDLALAAFLQIADNNVQDWYLNFVEFNGRLEGHMENLPGNATRYVVENDNWEDADLDLVTLFIPGNVLEALGLVFEEGEEITDELRYLALQEILRNAIGNDLTEETARAYLEKFLADNESELGENPFRLLYTDMWQRQYHTVIYLPNEQRELRVRKVDKYGNYINGAVFAIFKTAKDAAEFELSGTYSSSDEVLAALAEMMNGDNGLLSYGATATVDLDTSDESQRGLLIFQEREPSGNGYGQIDWPESYNGEDTIYWMKELYCPHGLTLNENLVRIEVGDLAIYANATGYRYDEEKADGVLLSDDDDEEKNPKTNDGIVVQAALGKLAQTLIKYAIGNHVDVTLQDITIRQQIQNGDANGALISGTGWEDTGDTFNLHYGMNAELLTGQFGRHNIGDIIPLFEVTDGYVRVMPRQHVDLSAYTDSEHNSTTKRDILTWNGQINGVPMDLDALFGLMNIVVITDELLPASLEISKAVEGIPGDEDKYIFDITLTPPKDDNGDPIELATVYHGYIHETGHTVTDPGVDGIPGTADDRTRPCTPGDHVDDHADLYLVYNKDSGKYIGKVIRRGHDESIDFSKAEPLTLKDGETYVIVDLEPETGYEIEEHIEYKDCTYETRIEVRDEEDRTDNEIGGTYVNGRLNKLKQDNEGNYLPVESVKVKFINTANQSGLTIEKVVKDSDTDRAFDFKVTLKGDKLNPEGYPCTAEDIDGNTIRVNVVWVYNEEDGTLTGTFSLRNGDKVTIAPLEPGIEYTVEELNTNGEWTVKATGDTGTIQENTRHIASFINTPYSDMIMLPNTGSSGVYGFIAIGTCLTLTGILMLMSEFTSIGKKKRIAG